MPSEWRPFVRQTRNLNKPLPCSSALTVLKWLDYWSLLFGLSIFAHERGKVFLWFNRVRAVMMIVSAVNSISTITQMVMNKAYLFAVNIAVYYTGQVIYCFAIHVYGKKISAQLSKLVLRMTQQQRIILQRTSCLLTLLMVVQLIEAKFLLIRTKIGINTWQNYLNLFLVSTEYDYNFYGCALFCILLIASYYSFLKSLEVVDRSVISLDILMYHTSLIKGFMSIVNTFAGFSFIILLSSMFISLPGSLSFFQVTILKEDLLWRTSEVVVVILQVISIISLVTLTTVLKRRLEGKRNIILSKIQSQWHSAMTIDWRICLDNFSDKSLFEFSIMSLAPLDIHLILSLASSIITFSILLVQYEQSLKQTTSWVQSP